MNTEPKVTALNGERSIAHTLRLLRQPSIGALCLALTELLNDQYIGAPWSLESLTFGNACTAHFRTSSGESVQFRVIEQQGRPQMPVVFGRWERAVEEGLPLPRIHSTMQHTLYCTVPARIRMFGYLSDRADGRKVLKWTVEHADAGARVMANLHLLGLQPPKRQGISESLANHISNAAKELVTLKKALPSAQNVLTMAEAILQETGLPPRLLRSHVLSDFRLTRLTFDGVGVKHIDGFENLMWGDRLCDLCRFLTSHPDPKATAFLSAAEIEDFVARYHTRFPLTPRETRFFRPGLIAMLVHDCYRIAGLPYRRGVSENAHLDNALALIRSLAEIPPPEFGVTWQRRSYPTKFSSFCSSATASSIQGQSSSPGNN